jgi:hypothetical protein
VGDLGSWGDVHAGGESCARHNCRIWGTRDMIQKTWKDIEFLLDVSRATNGAHIEMY